MRYYFLFVVVTSFFLTALFAKADSVGTCLSIVKSDSDMEKSLILQITGEEKLETGEVRYSFEVVKNAPPENEVDRDNIISLVTYAKAKMLLIPKSALKDGTLKKVKCP